MDARTRLASTLDDRNTIERPIGAGDMGTVYHAMDTRHNYCVMPFVDGESLRDCLNREPELPIGEALRVAALVADAIDYAHKRGIVHRDVKRENVLLVH